MRSQGAYFEEDWGVIVLCTMFLVSSSINVSNFHITWLNTFWKDIYIYTHLYIFIYVYEYIWMCIYIHIYSYTHSHIYEYIHIHIYLHIYLYREIYTIIHTQVVKLPYTGCGKSRFTVVSMQNTVYSCIIIY